MKQLFLSLIAVPIFLSFHSSLQAQTVVALDAGTNILVSSGSVSLEEFIYSSYSNKIHISGWFGVGAVGIFYDAAGPAIKMGGTFLTGQHNKHFEVNLGTYIINDIWGYGEGLKVWPVITLGYRYQKPDGGLVFKAFLGSASAGIAIGFAKGAFK